MTVAIFNAGSIVFPFNGVYAVEFFKVYRLTLAIKNSFDSLPCTGCDLLSCQRVDIATVSVLLDLDP